MTKYTIDVDDELWEKFKQVVTRDKTMNEAINELIKNEVKKSIR
jgi:Txe/YoeB family toxin of Txe-Axe toxin-antitoxin module